MKYDSQLILYKGTDIYKIKIKIFLKSFIKFVTISISHKYRAIVIITPSITIWFKF